MGPRQESLGQGRKFYGGKRDYGIAKLEQN
jgi:hypothetical protein